MVDIVGASQVVHLLLPAWRQRRQQLLRPLRTRVCRLVPALHFYKAVTRQSEKCCPEDSTLSLYILSWQVDGHSQEPEGRFRSFLLETAAQQEAPNFNIIAIKSFTFRVKEVRFLLLCVRFKYHKWLFNVLTWNRLSPHSGSQLPPEFLEKGIRKRGGANFLFTVLAKTGLIFPMCQNFSKKTVFSSKLRTKSSLCGKGKSS